MMDSYDKSRAIKQLADTAYDHDEIRDDCLAIIGKIVYREPVLNPVSPDYRSPNQPLSPTLDELCLCRSQGKIASIKTYRQRTGLSLRIAKENIERGMDYLGWEFVLDNNEASYVFEKLF